MITPYLEYNQIGLQESYLMWQVEDILYYQYNTLKLIKRTTLSKF